MPVQCGTMSNSSGGERVQERGCFVGQKGRTLKKKKRYATAWLGQEAKRREMKKSRTEPKNFRGGRTVKKTGIVAHVRDHLRPKKSPWRRKKSGVRKV